MGHFRFKKGHDIRLKGAAAKQIVKASLPSRIAIQPLDFRGIRPRLSVQEGNLVKVGTPLFADKDHPEIKIVSPVSGKVAAINRGEKRVLLQIVIEPDGKQEALKFHSFIPEELEHITRDKAVAALLEGGLWPVLRQRPFSKMAHPQDHPKSIFVQALNTEPLAPDFDVILANSQSEFQAGLNVLRSLTKGKVHLCFHEQAEAKALTQAKNVEKHQFSGPHPTGNVSTYIHYIDPIKKGDQVWYVEAQDVVRIGRLFLRGVYPAEKIIAVTGEGASERVYVQTVLGAPVNSLVKQPKEGMRYISGSVLRGTSVGASGFVCFYDSQITVIPEGGKREFLGWIVPGFNKYSFSKTFVSSFLPEKEVSLDTDKNGSDRAIVFNHVYDSLITLDVMTFFLMRAVISGDIEEAEKLGILECDEEDFALCSFACPSKTDVGGIIRGGLDLIEKEG